MNNQQHKLDENQKMWYTNLKMENKERMIKNHRPKAGTN